ncbi:MAG: Denitrification system component NirT [Rhodocyclaceae bacterium]|nr:MAG: Denitrification system component NirT [Rhodocyclaceae bacterium]MBE7421226.1 NapC/NirT family cytochrome c [Zoogloeaceae bacterium]MBV6407730.1 Denitrification system component NirT [Rhodocyclaceae bacterium]MCK6383056.1 NapC/NirT family cytochrome c [Rhodocyclaceae bacterium]CAG0944819.1 cytochrome c nitrite reductase small subunit [Gammaproteobacteria bacterium]
MSDSNNKSLFSRFWSALRRPSAKYSLLILVLGGFAAGIVFWGGFHTVVEATNAEAFCIGCHEMRNNVYEEYKNTIHYTNRTGVRAVCADCHVPKEWGPKMLRKIQASRELYGKVTGSVDTREKFEAKRLELAEREWKRMKANNSLECRNCHSMVSMDGEKQKQRARKQHEMAQRDGETCIDCHKGIAHQKPKGMKEDDEG